jgi:hypothetical protein
MTLQIPIDKQTQDFKQHLNEPKNERIIFSGIFGIGKSYFLNEYFKDREEYVTINLKPVNYSISSTDDIFRLIKYDILYELIFTHELQLTFESIERKIAYGVLFGDKVPGLMEAFLPLIHLLNKDIPDVSPLIAFINKFAPNFREAEKARKDVNENWKLLDFVKEVENTPLLEFDFITTFIDNSLESLSTVDEQSKKKSKVLIIDDLDRIDPEHIFRLFNIFSAHLDYHKSTTNKFGFDKVIFVCDIDNIRNIFAAKYGTNVDFSGYIDKFYSTEIYYFNNEEVAVFTNKIIKNINFGISHAMIKENLLHDDEESKTNFLYILLKSCIDSGALNMRRIQTVFNNKFSFVEKQVFSFSYQNQINNKNVPITIIFDILLWIFGDIRALENALNRLIIFGRTGKQIQEVRFNHNISGYLEMLIPIVDSAYHKFQVLDDSTNSSIVRKLAAKVNSKSVDLTYTLKIKNQDRFFIYSADLDNFNYRSNIDIELYEFTLEAFKVLKFIHYF